jgi:hypothetical protein
MVAAETLLHAVVTEVLLRVAQLVIQLAARLQIAKHRRI